MTLPAASTPPPEPVAEFAVTVLLVSAMLPPPIAPPDVAVFPENVDYEMFAAMVARIAPPGPADAVLLVNVV